MYGGRQGKCRVWYRVDPDGTVNHDFRRYAYGRIIISNDREWMGFVDEVLDGVYERLRRAPLFIGMFASKHKTNEGLVLFSIKVGSRLLDELVDAIGDGGMGGAICVTVSHRRPVSKWVMLRGWGVEGRTSLDWTKYISY